MHREQPAPAASRWRTHQDWSSRHCIATPLCALTAGAPCSARLHKLTRGTTGSWCSSSGPHAPPCPTQSSSGSGGTAAHRADSCAVSHPKHNGSPARPRLKFGTFASSQALQMAGETCPLARGAVPAGGRWQRTVTRSALGTAISARRRGSQRWMPPSKYLKDLPPSCKWRVLLDEYFLLSEQLLICLSSPVHSC